MLHCVNGTSPAARGFFVVSRDAAGVDVCSDGDAFALHVTQRRSPRLHFSALSRPVPTWPSVHFLATGALMLPGTHEYAFSLTLVEASRRRTPLSTRPPLLDWLMARRCMADRVPLSRFVHVSAAPLAAEPEPACASLPADPSQYAYVMAERHGACGPWCVGNATRQLHDTANAARRKERARQGFRHVLKPLGCRLRLFDEQRLAKWPRAKDRPCAIRFGRSAVSTFLFHYPSYRGLVNLKESQYETMCQHDIVVVESASEDFALPPSEVLPLRAASRLARTCSPIVEGAAAAKSWDDVEALCTAAAWIATANKSFRLDPWAAYERRLATLLSRWKQCRARRSSWRAIFQLSMAPRGVRAPADCLMGQRGLGSQTHHRAAINAFARRMVEDAGFEVFDPFAVTLHAPASWFDSERTPLEHASQEAEAVSDVFTQLLLNQLCGSMP